MLGPYQIKATDANTKVLYCKNFFILKKPELEFLPFGSKYPNNEREDH